MRVFVSEFVCGGAWGKGALEPSLAREGRAMLLAACEDFARIPGCEVRTTWDARLGPFPLNHVETDVVRGTDEEGAAFDRLVRQCDAAFVIAPEFERVLARRCARVEELGGKLLGSSIAAIELCADKLRLFSHLREHALPTIVTKPWSYQDESPPFEYPFVIKPRDGAGSTHTFLVTNSRELDEARRVYATLPAPWRGIAQPYIAGRSLSVGVLITEKPWCIEVFPPCEQILSNDGRFHYCGGCVDGGEVLSNEHAMLVREMCASIPGLHGYVGIDYLVPNDATGDFVIVEINPRLTTSYLGYRKLSEVNLLTRLIDGAACNTGIGWRGRSIQFSPEGVIE